MPEQAQAREADKHEASGDLALAAPELGTAPSPAEAALLTLQRQAGNRAVVELLTSGPTQRNGPGARGLVPPFAQIGRSGVQRAPDEVRGPDAAPERPAGEATSDGAETSSAGAAAPRRATGYVGLNPKAGNEVTALERAAGADSVLATTGDAALEAKLQADPALADYVFDELGISPAKVDRWGKAIDALTVADPRTRDTLGALMRWMNEAEDGQIVLDRLVLSGHSNGFQLWGDSEGRNAPQKPGVLVLERDLANVAAAFPRAAAQVRSIMFSACETVGAVDTVVRIFPNLDSVWAYAGFSPDIKSGSAKHIQQWAKATAGSGTPTKADARGATAIWTRKDKFIVKDPGKGNIETLLTEAMSGWLLYAMPMLRGEREYEAAALAPLYNRVQAVLAHPAASADRKATMKKMMEVLLRLRHWEKIRVRFGEVHGQELVEPYRQLGLTPPTWASLSRRALMAHVELLARTYEKQPHAVAAKEKIDHLVRVGLGQLDESVIKPDWN